MSTDYSFSIGIGFYFSRDEFFGPFLREVPEKSHMEKRFDPRTGKETNPEKVIDQESHEEIVFDNKSFDDAYEFANAFEKKFKCQVTTADVCGELKYVVIGPKLSRIRDSADTDMDFHTNVGDDVRPEDFKFDEIKKILKSLGLKPKKPVIKICCSAD